MIRAVFVVLCAGTFVLGQTASNTLRITASRTINAQPDQVVFSFTVNAPIADGLDEVLGGLSSLGVTAANLQSLYGPSTVGSGASMQAIMQWSFSLPVAYSKAKDTAAGLASLNGPLTLAYYSSSPNVSTQAQCPLADLVGDAQAQAQKVAAASGFTVGSIVAISDGNNATSVPTSLIRSGDFAVISPYPLFAPAIVAQACTLVVDFTIARL